MCQFGVGELVALTVLTEFGDVRRMSGSRKAVRFAGMWQGRPVAIRLAGIRTSLSVERPGAFPQEAATILPRTLSHGQSAV